MIDRRKSKWMDANKCVKCYPNECACYKEPKEYSCYKEPKEEYSCCKEPKECSCYKEPKKWNALDPTDEHPFNSTVVQDADAILGNGQYSIESIVVKDSCDVDVSSSDTQTALNIQVALQIAIAIVISISIADSNQADNVTQDLFAKLKSTQMNKQQVFIENSRGVNVTTTDTDIAVNIQVLLQVLIALIARIDVL